MTAKQMQNKQVKSDKEELKDDIDNDYEIIDEKSI